MKCCLCGKQIEVTGAWSQGHNANPIKDGRCCSDCNDSRVIPARLTDIIKDWKTEFQ